MSKFTRMSGLKRLGTVAVAGVLLMATVLTGCGSQNNGTQPQKNTAAVGKPQMGGTYLTYWQDDPKSLDPAQCGDVETYDFLETMFDGLLTWDQSGKKIIPDLAEAMPTVSNNGTTYTFKLRQGITFTNGDPLTADDVVYTFNRLAAHATASVGASYYTMIKGFNEMQAGHAKTLAGVKAVDKYTVQFDLTQANRTFADVIAMPFAYIVDKKVVSALANPYSSADFSKDPVGTGPFKFVEWKKGQIVKVVRNPHYFMKDQYGQQLPYLAGITWKLGIDDPIAFMKFKDKELDFSRIPAAEFVNTINNPAMKPDIRTLVANDLWYFYVNNADPPFNKPLVRQALEYAINKQDVLKTVNNRGVEANEILPPNMPGYKANPAGYSYDLAKAKKLLSEAGYPKGLPGTYDLIYTKAAANDPIVANIQAQLKQIGMNVQLRGLPFPQYLNTIQTGKAVVSYGGWVQDYPDPDDFLDILFNSAGIPSQNNWEYKNATVDKLLNEAVQNPNLDQVIPTYHKIEKQIMEDAAIVPIYHSKVFRVVQPWVENANLHPVYCYFDYTHLWINQKAEKAAKG
ncbi:Solute-binding protein family 5 domain [Acididesulfobacillus acetoxydans]|uniref:Periplasmic oligopeptide-binding protein n=1 Tax=Acididesulfobacillus acetoxydans TaxID=1561005 RepID=A0A8S0WWL1_9FIRM|nr:ABC transporter substrate-binding protein [Acididesulfobacillus acetoxydans]CAA7600361.1 Solute-binding protein family 5 domain [Acididesulfobacillus acetoxydans]CEJ07883.1 Periplasmic oligopeptide-binding protein [Acididesulfobacillus acetoxydans]